MSDNKMNLSDLIQELATNCAISKVSAELFAKAFFTQIEEGLLKDGMVKINNFGTFKAQWNEARKSVNVNTGEEFIIPAHPRITFTPEQEIKDLINHPFAYLQPTPIGKDIQEEEEKEHTEVTPEKENDTTESVGDTLQKLNDDADEIKALLCDINGEDWMRDNNEKQEEDVHTDDTTQEELQETEEIATEAIETPEEEAEVHVEVKKAEEHVEPNVTETQHISTPQYEGTPDNTPEETNTPQTKGKFWKIAISITAVLCLLVVGVYVYLTHRVEQWAEDKIASATTTEEPLTTETDLLEDTLTTEESITEDSIAPTPTAETTEEVVETTTEAPVTYEEFIDTVQLTEGSRLAWLAKKYYGSAYFWVYIYEANKEQLPNPNDIPVGTSINIPKLPQELIDPTNEECISKAKELQNKILNK